MKPRTTRAFVVAAASISLGALGLLGVGALYGCDTGDAASPQNAANRDSGLGSPATDGGPIADGSTDGNVQDTGIADAGFPSEAGPALNNCTNYVDHRGAANVNLPWGLSVADDPDHCSKISAGATVTWISSSFATHPLMASAGGDTPNPIDITGAVDSGGGAGSTVTIAFPSSGAFPYECATHSFMLGTIVVDGPVDAGGD